MKELILDFIMDDEETVGRWEYVTVFILTCIASAALLTAVSGILG